MSSSWEKSLREQRPTRKHPKNPSFSTILLDEMFRSMDGEDGKQPARTTGQPNRTKPTSRSIEDEEVASLRRAYLMEKLMESKIKNKAPSSRRRTSSLPDMEGADPLFFSTTSCSSSSDSSSGGLSLSDAEFYTSAKSATSCFSSSKSKTYKHSGNNNNKAKFPPKPHNHNHFASYYEQGHEYYLFDDYINNQQRRSRADEENLVKSKSRALKIYSNLKKVRQPISPGGRLTSFINSLFANGNSKNAKNGDVKDGHDQDSRMGRKPGGSGSSVSRSCLNYKNAPGESGTTKYETPGSGKTRVRFYNDDRKQSLAGWKSDKSSHFLMEKNRTIIKEENNHKKKDYLMKERFVQEYEHADDYYDDDGDAASDSSSDLFEIDHLALFADKRRFCEDLPVYETTHLDRKNLSIATSMIC